MASKIKVDQLETADGSGTIALQNQLSGMTSASMPTGSVLQVVQATSITEATSTSTTFADYDLTASLTPTSTSSKILVMITLAGILKKNANNLSKHRVVRGASTVISAWNNLSPYNNTTDRESDQMSINYLDSPATTSSTSYKVQFCLYSGATGDTLIGNNSSMSTMTLMEIAG